MTEDYRYIEITVALKIRADADPQEVVSEMDYDMSHKDLLETEIVDINTEF